MGLFWDLTYKICSIKLLRWICCIWDFILIIVGLILCLCITFSHIFGFGHFDYIFWWIIMDLNFYWLYKLLYNCRHMLLDEHKLLTSQSFACYIAKIFCHNCNQRNLMIKNNSTCKRTSFYFFFYALHHYFEGIFLCSYMSLKRPS